MVWFFYSQLVLSCFGLMPYPCDQQYSPLIHIELSPYPRKSGLLTPTLLISLSPPPGSVAALSFFLVELFLRRRSVNFFRFLLTVLVRVVLLSESLVKFSVY